MTKHDVIAVTDTVKEAGGVVWWALSGTTNLAALTEAWTDVGLDPILLPRPVGPELAMHRAADEQKEAHRLVRRLPDRSGWAIVDESGQSDDLSYNILCRVRLDFCDRITVDPSCSLADQVEQAFYRHLGQLSSGDVGSWLVHLSVWAKGVSLRPNGGLYFVPRQHLDEWRRMANVIESVSGHRLWLIPALRGSEAVAAVLEAVQVEAKAHVEAMTADLQEGQLGARGLNNRVDRCEQVANMLSAYDELLGTSLDDIRANLNKLRARLAAAALVASSEEDNEQAA